MYIYIYIYTYIHTCMCKHKLYIPHCTDVYKRATYLRHIVITWTAEIEIAAEHGIGFLNCRALHGLFRAVPPGASSQAWPEDWVLGVCAR